MQLLVVNLRHCLSPTVLARNQSSFFESTKQAGDVRLTLQQPQSLANSFATPHCSGWGQIMFFEEFLDLKDSFLALST